MHLPAGTKSEIFQLSRYFDYEHLPAHLQKVSKPVHDLAEQMILVIGSGPELHAGLRKLLEAKDCLVRAALDKQV
ncbi:hypothetical protein [Herbidospora mongoliensis]|uniref:hypothetical protein n=1 Tax=Herbidospora mongoliensis TaxID=688067 RepID=UPI0008336440|nr:hypothetical protein [Herbidospora mongoliensis]